jgi:flagellar motor switch protein FliM
VALESTHEAFARRLATAWSTSTHAALEIEHVATEQLSIDDYVRTLPNPTVLATLRVGRSAPPPARPGRPAARAAARRAPARRCRRPGQTAVPRRPTDLETSLIAHELLEPGRRAIDEALRDLEGEPSELLAVRDQPPAAQLAAPASCCCC